MLGMLKKKKMMMMVPRTMTMMMRKRKRKATLESMQTGTSQWKASPLCWTLFFFYPPPVRAPRYATLLVTFMVSKSRNIYLNSLYGVGYSTK
jgi:hypothetical protein